MRTLSLTEVLAACWQEPTSPPGGGGVTDPALAGSWCTHTNDCCFSKFKLAVKQLLGVLCWIEREGSFSFKGLQVTQKTTSAAY